MLVDKTMFLETIKGKIETLVTEEQLKSILSVVDEELKSYDLSKIASGSISKGDQELFNAFIAAKELEGRSPKTIARYKYEIKKMLTEIESPLEMINPFHLRIYLHVKKEKGVCDNTLEGIRNIISSFFGWLHKEGLIHKNPCLNLGVIKCPKVQRLPFSSTDMEKMRESCTSIRDRTIISFLSATGCRISELTSINVTDVSFDSKEVKVLGKGNKERVVYLDDVSVMLCKRYLEGRDDKHEALFIGRGTERISANGIRSMLKQLEKSSGVENIHPHRFRRTLATNLINHGMPIQEVSIILGHEKLDTTMKYVYTEKERVKSSYMRVSW